MAFEIAYRHWAWHLARDGCSTWPAGGAFTGSWR